MTTRIIAAVVDVRQLRLYKEDGSTIDIPQGDPRVAVLVEACKPLSNPAAFKLPVNENGKPYVELDTTAPERERDTTFADFEQEQQKAGRFTRFFRVVKSKIQHLVGNADRDAEVMAPAPIAPVSLGSIPVPQAPTPNAPAEPITKIDNAIADIMAHAKPVTDADFHEDDTKSHETIIAIVDDGKGQAAIVPGVQSLKPYMVHANKTGNHKGMEAFLSRLSKFIKERGHTVDDILRFMDKGDLPLADDGCIIAYKVLRSTKTHDNSPLSAGTFVDCYTGRIEQRVGSYVHQSINLIRQDKQECGTGLHIARRGYLRHFGGDIIVMVKIRPEDVIVVPHNEPDKVRVKGYHILAKIPKDEHEKLRSNTAMTGTNALKLLTQAIAGEHIGIIERIEITSANGGSFTRTLVEGEGKAFQPMIKKDTAISQPVAPAPVIPKPTLDAPKIDPKQVAKEVETTKAAKPKTKADEARDLYVAGKLVELKAFKKAAKKSWTALGFTAAEEELIMSSDVPVTNGQKPGSMTKAEQAKQEEVVSKATPIVEAVSEQDEPIQKDPGTPHIPNAKTKAALKDAKAGKTIKTGTVENTMKELNTPEPKKEKPKMTGTRAEVARQLFERATATGEFAGKPVEKQAWGHLWLHRKECKKGWDLLGFTPKEIERIKANKPDHV